ncbi:DUF4178 domain-containing protein [Paenibacillus beijingensis]|uniref:DUF4178 domain-containing protein n=1 Tax=Paenibacillus beijingensis TaxID=1126833 RepID=A0A0D5NDN5_9BACL|nr:DUF4178 domain-containing protein [Paenibacillus beijingensis]AJY73341.1 hypothetical protein VN24_00235 [Paenibacillus beijingensis]
MSLFKRVANLLKTPEPPKAEKSILTLAPGDICEVSLITYQVVGRTQNHRRRETFLSLQDGADSRYLHIEERMETEFSLYIPIDGRLDSIDEVPSSMELDDRMYYLEEQYSGHVIVSGRTPFSQSGELYVWHYQSDDRKLLRIEWQDGRFMLYEGESVLPADVKVLRGN